jgi:hypothetical protein
MKTDVERAFPNMREIGRATRRIIVGVLALGLVRPGTGLAEETVPSAASAPADQVHSWRTGGGKSYLIPALEIPSFLILLNLSDRLIYGDAIYGSTYKSSRDHLLHGPWKFDNDPFNVNQLGHPYQGAMMYGFARSAGLSFWESLVYSNAGSLMWKIAGETDAPSINDQITTGNAGSLLGEPLFRMANLVLGDGGDDPGFWRSLGACFISPPTVLNRLVFGERFEPLYPSHNPATFTQVRLGSSLTVREEDHGFSNTESRKETSLDFSMDYGLPGKPGYTYRRPFDYFNFQFTAVDGKTSFENLMTRGLLYGTDYELGDDYRGVWGLYGSYDYLSPKVFRVSSTAGSLGTTGQWWLSRDLALQGTALAGPGFGAAGTTATVGQRDYHYGATVQELLALRLIFGNVAMLDASGREYYVSEVGSTSTKGTERIARGNVSFTLRVFRHHAIGIQYVESRRNAEYANLPTRAQSEKTFSLNYNFIGDKRFGEVEWRNGMDSDDR